MMWWQRANVCSREVCVYVRWGSSVCERLERPNNEWTVKWSGVQMFSLRPPPPPLPRSRSLSVCLLFPLHMLSLSLSLLLSPSLCLSLSLSLPHCLHFITSLAVLSTPWVEVPCPTPPLPLSPVSLLFLLLVHCLPAFNLARTPGGKA